MIAFDRTPTGWDIVKDGALAGTLVKDGDAIRVVIDGFEPDGRLGDTYDSFKGAKAAAITILTTDRFIKPSGSIGRRLR